MKRKQPSKPTASPVIGNPELQHIEQLLRYMSEHNLEEFEYAHGDLKIRLRKPSTGTVMGIPRQMAAPEIIVASGGVMQPPANPPIAPSAQGPEGRSAEDLHVVKSPIVGTYYGSPSPGAEPFVQVGAYVETGQTLCIVEAMKLMNEIEADVSGEVVRCLVSNGQAIEFGQPLFAIRP
jgi:acetyl-CoA carboxylase biotin carboxyl carrier protein